MAFRSLVHMDEEKEKGRKTRRSGVRVGFRLRYPWNTGEMASLHPKFAQGLSKVLSKTLDCSSWMATLRLLHSVSSLAKSQTPSIFWQMNSTCVWSSAFQNARGQGQGCAAIGISSPTATQLVEIVFLEEVGRGPALSPHRNNYLHLIFSTLFLHWRVLESQFKSHFKLFFA